VEELRKKVYTQWSWNYGASPPYTLHKARRIEGCGKIEVFLDVEREGKIKSIAFYGDFFGNRDPLEFAGKLIGCHLEYSEVKTALAGTDISLYFHALKPEDFFTLIFA
jgi:lipoate-protein ligase A